VPDSEDLLLLAWRLAVIDPDPAAPRHMRRLLAHEPLLTDEVIVDCAWDAGLDRGAMRILSARIERGTGGACQHR
jgi:hypothetical protein